MINKDIIFYEKTTWNWEESKVKNKQTNKQTNFFYEVQPKPPLKMIMVKTQFNHLKTP